jgi:hypothetical protein
MSMCPLCNQFNFVEYRCPNCLGTMEDQGRVIDFFDDYSPYLDIDGMKLADGFPDDLNNHQCPHTFYCSHCNESKLLLVQEWVNEYD